jgi:DNA-directed RNA polymerase specialized sigma24 family protein
MSADHHRAEETGGGAAAFGTTHWSVVIAASHRESPQAAEALEKLCSTYWYPLYACVRRQGYSPEDAQDLTQDFFTRLLARDYLARADPHWGKFRSFLLAGLERFLCDEWDKVHRLKRGGGQKAISFDAQLAEERYRLEPVEPMTPERLFERSWAMTLLEHAAGRLRQEYVSAGKADQYEQLTDFRLDVPEQPAYAQAATHLGLSESAVKSAIYRLRQRHHQLVREEIVQTLADPAEVDEEIQYLLKVIAD